MSVTFYACTVNGKRIVPVEGGQHDDHCFNLANGNAALVIDTLGIDCGGESLMGAVTVAEFCGAFWINHEALTRASPRYAAYAAALMGFALGRNATHIAWA